MKIDSVVLSTFALMFGLGLFSQAQAQSARALIGEAGKAMGGMTALRAVKNQVVESEGKQFDSSSTPQPLGPTRQISTFRYTLAREIAQPKLRLEWESRYSARGETIRFIEVIDGSVGILEEGVGRAAKQSRLHPGRLVTRLREEKRSPVNLILSVAANKSLRRLADAERDGVRYHVVAFTDGGDEFQIYLDPQSKLPAQTDILEDDPLEGDSSYFLRYGNWRRVGEIMMPFNLRTELNGSVLQEEQIKSVRNNVKWEADRFNVPQPLRDQKDEIAPIASQWILRRVAGNVSYQDFGRSAKVEWSQLADGVHKLTGSSHATIVVEMRDHLIAVEGPLYDARSAPVVKSIKERFPGKPIRYVIPTHHHLDHAGGIRAFMAEGATVIVPFSAQNFYAQVSRSAHTRQPDSLEKSRTPVVIESFGGGPRVLTDGVRRVEVYPLPTSHAQDLVIVYLPAEKLLIEADHISPRNGQVRSAPEVKEFVPTVNKLNIDVATIVGIHGDSAPWQAAQAAAK